MSTLSRVLDHYHAFLLTGLIGFVIFSHVSWLQEDSRYQPFVDPYPERALEITDHLSMHGLSQLPHLLEEARIGPRSPLYQFGMGLLAFWAGRSVDTMLGLNLLMICLLMIAAYFTGKLLKNWSVGLLAALFVGTYPPLVNLARIARPHAILPAMIMLWLLFLLQMLKRRTVTAVWGVCLVLVFALWLHPNAFYLLPIPSLLFTLYAIFEPDKQLGLRRLSHSRLPGISRIKGTAVSVWHQLNDPFVIKGVLPGYLVAFLLTAAWYFFVREDVTELVQTSKASWTNVRYGFGHIPASFWWYLWTLPGAVTTFFAFLFLAGFLLNLLAKRRYRFILSLIFLLMYLGMGLREGTLAWMNFAAILPVIGVITAIFLDDLLDLWRQVPKLELMPANHLRIDQLFVGLLACAAVAIALFNFYFVTSEVSENTILFAQAIGAPIDSACGWRMTVVYCPNPPRNQDWKEREILQTILNAPDCFETPCSVAIITESAEIFSFASLRYFAAQEFPEVSLEILPIRNQNQQSIDWLTTDFLVYIPQLQNNEYANAIVEFLENPSDDFATVYQPIEEISVPRGWHVTILKRNRMLHEAEFDEFINLLNLPNEMANTLDHSLTFRDMDE